MYSPKSPEDIIYRGGETCKAIGKYNTIKIQTRNLSQSSIVPVRLLGSAASFVSDGTLNIQTSNRNPSINIYNFR
jgi:hypothetical protein